MRKHSLARAGLAPLVAAALVGACVPAALAAAQDGGAAAGDASASSAPAVAAGQDASTAVWQKSEVVYASLGAEGGVRDVYVVNRFDVEAAGTVVDHGDYAAVQNLTSEAELSREGDATVFEAEEGTLYYQGDAARAELPWNVAISYRLDGKEVPAEELAGASGKLAIHLTTSRNEAVAESAFYDSFMLQITFTLPGGVAFDVQGEGATIASLGEDTTLAFTALPGHDGDFELTARVEGFHMDGVQIAALPYSSVVEMPDTSSMVSGMDDLSSAVSRLAEGTSSLASGVDQLTKGAKDLASGSAAFGEGLAQVSGSSGALVDASASIKSALDGASSALAGADLSQLDQLGQLGSALGGLADGMDALAQGTAAAQEGYSQAVGALDAAMAGVPDAAVSEEDLASLYALAQAQGTAGDAVTLNHLVETYRAAQAAKGAWAACKQAFDGADAALSASSSALVQQADALRQTASQVDAALASGQLSQIGQLVDGLSQLADSYGRFHEGLVQYASGVSALASSYAQLESGTASLSSGTGQLASGAGELSGGMGQLNASTAALPETVRKQIAEMTAGYEFPEFDPVSFASPENEGVGAVQFVMAAEGIELPEEPQAEEEEPEQTIWDRFLALFS